MQIIPASLRPAQEEVHKAAHNQDLTEIPKRARMDREREALLQLPAQAVLNKTALNEVLPVATNDI